MVGQDGALGKRILVQHKELLRIPDWQIPQQQLVHQGEDGGVGANPQGQRESRHGRENRTLTKRAPREAKILDKRLHVPSEDARGSPAQQAMFSVS